MKEINIKVPDNKYHMFLQLMKEMRFVEIKKGSFMKEETLEKIEKGYLEAKEFEKKKKPLKSARAFLKEL